MGSCSDKIKLPKLKKRSFDGPGFSLENRLFNLKKRTTAAKTRRKRRRMLQKRRRAL